MSVDVDIEMRMTLRQEAWTRFAVAMVCRGTGLEQIAVCAEQLTVEWEAMRQRDIEASEAAIEQERLERERQFAKEREKENQERDRRKRAEDHAAVMAAELRQKAAKKQQAKKAGRKTPLRSSVR